MKHPRMRLHASPTMVLAALTALAGGCALSAEGELPEVEVTQHDLAIPAAPLDADGGEVSLAVTFHQKPTRLGLEGATFSRVQIQGIQIAATGGITDLVFLSKLRITATSPQAQTQGAKPVEVARYERADATEVGARLELVTTPPADVTQLWTGTDLLFTLEITGQLPTVPWSADVGLRFGATVSY
jgi:hypothetical protein